jgi:hypothetical protein
MKFCDSNIVKVKIWKWNGNILTLDMRTTTHPPDETSFHVINIKYN